MSKAKFQHTPESAAKAMRVGFEKQIAKTWADYEAERNGGPFMNCYQFGKLVQEQADCSFREAVTALQSAIPELFADYWEHKLRS
jgi:hypothetical protein